MPSVDFDLTLTPDELELLYQGVQFAQAMTDQGKRVRFPAGHLRPYITHQGIRGRFRLSYSDQGKFISLTPVP